MWKKILDGLRGEAEPRMPEVEPVADIEAVFREARTTAQSAQADGQRHVVLVTPGRLLMAIPCPSPGTMAPERVLGIGQPE